MSSYFTFACCENYMSICIKMCDEHIRQVIIVVLEYYNVRKAWAIVNVRTEACCVLIRFLIFCLLKPYV